MKYVQRTNVLSVQSFLQQKLGQRTAEYQDSVENVQNCASSLQTWQGYTLAATVDQHYLYVSIMSHHHVPMFHVIMAHT